MATRRCPEGHESASADYCDVCGAPMPESPGGAPVTGTAPIATVPPAAPSAPAAPPAPAGPAVTKPCPSCQAANVDDALFCEVCGYDFTTGQLPPEPAPPTHPRAAATPAASPVAATPNPLSIDTATAVDWVAEIWVDPEWYARNRDDTTDPCPSPGMPKVIALVGTAALVGRPSSSRHVAPQIDCTPDTGVSRKHAQMLLDADRWYLEDLGSTNGTYVAAAGAPLPTDPIPSGQRREVGENDRVYVGTWTRIVVRRATAQERGD